MIRIRLDKVLQARLQALLRQSGYTKSDHGRLAIRRVLQADDLKTQPRQQV